MTNAKVYQGSMMTKRLKSTDLVDSPVILCFNSLFIFLLWPGSASTGPRPGISPHKKNK